MNTSITLGAEEELQIVDQHSLELAAHDFERGKLDFPDQNGSSSCELHKAVVELQTPICQTPDQIVASVAAMREVIRQRAQAQGQRILSAGVHPFSNWKEQEINRDHQVSAIVNGKKPGDTIKVEVERNGDRRTVEVRLGERPASAGGSSSGGGSGGGGSLIP